MAFSHEAIEDMNTQTAYAKVEAETPVAKDSAAYDKQRDRKKNAAKASEANASRDPKVAGADRSPPAGDPAASPTRARTATATVGGTNATARGPILRAPIGRISRRNC